MTKTVFLHIGTPKTGTNAIQYFLYGKREELKTHGLLSPTTASHKDAFKHRKQLIHMELSNALGFRQGKKTKVDIYGQELATIAKDLTKEIKECSAHSVIFSSEFFCIPSDIKPVKEFFSHYDIRIVIYLRRHDSWWQSAYCQNVKTVKNPPWERSIEAYINFSKKRSVASHYKSIVDRWAEAFGKEKIIVRPYERQQNQPNLIADLLSALHFESALPLASDLKTEFKNQSLPYSKLYLIDIFQRANIDHDIRNRLIRYILEKPFDSQEPNPSLLPPQLQLQLIEENMADYEYIAREYLGRKDGKLFYDPLPDPNATWNAPKHPTLLEIVEQIIQCLT